MKSTWIGPPVGLPYWSNRWAQMSWSVLEYALTQTATDVPLLELALSETVLSVDWVD